MSKNNCQAERQKIAELEAEIKQLKKELKRIRDLCHQAQKDAMRVQSGAARGEWSFARGQDELAAKILQASPVIEYQRQGTQKRTRETYRSRKTRRQGSEDEKVIGRVNPWGVAMSLVWKFIPGGWLIDLVKK